MSENTELSHQEIPAKTRCPKCSAPPTSESVNKRHLSEMGYLHEDIFLECSSGDCDEEWICGIPIGEFDRDALANDLRCGSCGEWQLVHRVRTMTNQIELHLKCPDPECFTFERATRDIDDHRVALVGYPQITGNTEGCDPYGYPETDADTDVDGDS